MPSKMSYSVFGFFLVFLILWFYSCTHSYKNDEKKIVLNDSIGGHIHIINGKYAKSFCFLYRHHFLAIVTCILVLSYGLF
jgi:uncharacterized membrane protein YozB (DUF420 family)